MLRPTKHSHPDKTVIYATIRILSRLKKSRIDNYSDLLDYTKKNIAGGNVLFLPALNFLFLMGLIKYHPKNDSIEYVIGRNEAV